MMCVKGGVTMLFAVTNLDALRENALYIRKRCSVKLIAVLKYNAYACGMAECARALDGIADVFAVSNLAEAAALIAAAIPPDRIMVLDPILPAELTPDLTGTILPIDCPEILHGLDDIYINRPLRVQLRVDVCNSGIGLRETDFAAALESVVRNPRLSLYGVFAHAPSLYRREEVRETAARFAALREQTRAVAPGAVCHIATSAALSWESLRFDAVRVGTALYGLPSREEQSMHGLRPVLSLRASLLRVFENPAALSFYDKCVNTAAIQRAGIVSAGYGALPALLHPRGLSVLIHGIRAPLIGSPGMGHFIVNLTDIEQARVGDEVVLVGQYSGRAQTAAAFARSCGIQVCRCDGALFTTPSAARIYIDKHNCIVQP